MWRALVRLDRLKPPECRPYTVRSRCLVVDVRKTAGKRVQVTYRDSEGVLRGILAKRVVMCMPKHVAKYIIHDLAGLDGAKASALQHLEYRAYMMANVLLDAPISPDFYDIFLLDNAHFPMTGDEFALQSRVVDVLNGDFAGNPSSPRSVLTLYWPLPFPSGRFTMLDEHTYENYTSSFAAQMRSILGVLDLPLSAVKQIRMARWGHALPVAAVGLIADGTLELVRRPIDDKIFFVEQDNWALPAVENCLLDAHHFAPQIAAGLRRFSVGS